MTSEWIIVLTISGSIGIALMFVGVLMTLLTALGNRHYIYGALSFLLFPVALAYCFQYRKEASYPAKLLFPGTAIALITAIIGWALYVNYGLILQ